MCDADQEISNPYTISEFWGPTNYKFLQHKLAQILQNYCAQSWVKIPNNGWEEERGRISAPPEIFF